MLDWVKSNAIPMLSIMLLLAGGFTAIKVSTATLEVRITSIESEMVSSEAHVRKNIMYNAKVDELERAVAFLAAEDQRLRERVGRAEVSSERTAVAVENLVLVTSALNKTVSNLTVTVAKLQERTSN